MLIGRTASARRGRGLPGAAKSPRRSGSPTQTLSSRECAVLGLILVERLSLAEASAALRVSVAQFRREYEIAVSRVHRRLVPVLERARRSAGASRSAAPRGAP